MFCEIREVFRPRVDEREEPNHFILAYPIVGLAFQIPASHGWVERDGSTVVRQLPGVWCNRGCYFPTATAKALVGGCREWNRHIDNPVI